jgi:hypothetical protein
VTARRRIACRRIAYLGCTLLVLGRSRSLTAAPPSHRLPVELEVDPCTGVAPDVVGRIFTVELGVSVTYVPAGEASEPAQKPDTTLVSLSCDEGTIRMVVRDPLSGKMLERHVDLRAQRSSARPRLLSLSAAELVAASWIELDAVPAPPPAPIVEATALPPARTEAAEAARAAISRRLPVQWDVEAIAVGRRFPDANLTTWGGGVAATWAFEGWLALAGNLLGEVGSIDVRHDGAMVGTASLETGSVGLCARLRRSWPTFALEGGVGGRLFLTRLRGTAEEQPGGWVEHSFTGTWGGPLAEVRVGWKVSPVMLVVASVEGGTVTRQLAGFVAKRPDVVIDGSWAALSLGIGLGSDGPFLAR